MALSLSCTRCSRDTLWKAQGGREWYEAWRCGEPRATAERHLREGTHVSLQDCWEGRFQQGRRGVGS